MKLLIQLHLESAVSAIQLSNLDCIYWDEQSTAIKKVLVGLSIIFFAGLGVMLSYWLEFLLITSPFWLATVLSLS